MTHANIIVAGPEDAPRFAHVAADLFDAAIRSDWLESYLSAGHLHIAIACLDGQVTAFASGVTYHHPDKPTELFVNEVGTAPAYWRRGLGRAVLSRLLDHGRSRGAHVAWVLTERDNAAACALYAGLGGEPEGDAHVMFTFDLRRGDKAS